MTITGALVIFFISWWLVFLAVLPIGVRGQFEDGDIVEGSEPGAPVEHNLRQKAIWATIGAGVIVVLVTLFALSGIASPA